MNSASPLAVLTKEIALSSENSSSTEKFPTDGTAYERIDRISRPISYEDFFEKYLLQNKPCIFGSFFTDNWPSRKDWVEDDGCHPDFEFLKSHFGDVTVPVANCEKVQYDAQPKEDMTLRDYLDYWQKHIKQNYESEKGCLYMKDMHFTRDCSFYNAYTTLVYFSSDWLNEFWDARADCDRDDYRFVYMGPKGSWTPFHADVFRSFSWSANVCGKKRWILVPAGQEKHLQDHLGNLPYDVTSCGKTDNRKSYTPMEVVQSVGEVIFVPSGWHHQVFNMEDTISINHNWFNGTSISRSFVFLQSELNKVQKSIDDCRDMDGWEKQCQLILKASSGMDYQEFFQLLVSVSRRRFQVIRDGLDEVINLSNSAACVQCQADTGVHRVHESVSCDLSGDKTSCEDADKRFTCTAGNHQSNPDVEWNAFVETHNDEDKNTHEHISHDILSAKLLCDDTELKSRIKCFGETDVRHLGQSLTFWHAVYDLRQVKRVLEDFIKDPNINMLEFKYHDLEPINLIDKITKMISKLISINLPELV
ncbi:putative jmjC domain-containing protein 4 [Apostichopus japonicus]|uniref:2-oxoglutarate and iron-dependent oxygenase JMJD4 n=1 Tax=Stichopus japonicus TaxID=307972 RepID=A0A2G8JXC4_STIJA|nr:putative jmjC domain-containing protein 4 [Apostichopus japonicus]